MTALQLQETLFNKLDSFGNSYTNDQNLLGCKDTVLLDPFLKNNSVKW